LRARLDQCCLHLNPDTAGAAYGYAGMGPYRGGQAQKVLVPYADFNALKVPGGPYDEHEDDFLMLADSFPAAGTPPSWRRWRWDECGDLRRRSGGFADDRVGPLAGRGRNLCH